MDFSFIIPRIRGKHGRIFSRKNEEDFHNIYILKEKLTAMGYNPGEVDFMIKSSSNGIKLSKLNSIQLEKIKITLEEQLFIAEKCLELIKDQNSMQNLNKAP